MGIETEELMGAIRSGVIKRATVFIDRNGTVIAWNDDKNLDDQGKPVVKSVGLESASDVQAFMQMGVSCSIDGPQKRKCKFDIYFVGEQEILR